MDYVLVWLQEYSDRHLYEVSTKKKTPQLICIGLYEVWKGRYLPEDWTCKLTKEDELADLPLGKK